MGCEGHAGWYQDTNTNDAERIVGVLARVLVSTQFSQVYRSMRPDDSWNQAVDFDPTLAKGAIVSGAAVVYPAGERRSVEIGSPVTPNQFVAACGENHYVRGYVDIPRPNPVELETTERIPESIRDQWRANTPYLKMGWHDLYEGYDELRYIARAWFSISFWDYGFPCDREEFKRLFFDLPSVQRVRAALESDLGPLKEFGIWTG
ncbi:MAG: hypothetical protein KF787_12040 [Phycisphaeraceae bacterium]|nr:hypothetical protein [Phycisphaerae bacterium]MBX3393366.1 hypothetical protein [Phycisphaeraceae bacterium]HRJ49708.1 hypothetical protein [Phycisphaerales bacterium]